MFRHLGGHEPDLVKVDVGYNYFGTFGEQCCCVESESFEGACSDEFGCVIFANVHSNTTTGR